MIVTTEHASNLGHIVLQAEHTRLAVQIAQAFGNEEFAAPEPRDLVEFVVLNHDRGWDPVDHHMQRNPQTGLPFSLDKTPLNLLLSTISHSIAFNESHHPYCGLLAAMHVWGLYHGRYGMADQITIEQLNGAERQKADAVLEGVGRKIEALKASLARDPVFAPFVHPGKLMQNYKLLQFCDRLSLYFNFCVGKDGEPIEIQHVPSTETQDASLHVTPLGGKRYSMRPFPFKGREVHLSLVSYESASKGQDEHAGPEEWPAKADSQITETLTISSGLPHAPAARLSS